MENKLKLLEGKIVFWPFRIYKAINFIIKAYIASNALVQFFFIAALLLIGKLLARENNCHSWWVKLAIN